MLIVTLIKLRLAQLNMDLIRNKRLSKVVESR